MVDADIARSMANPGSIVVASVALVFGLAVAVAGVVMMLEAGSFVTSSASQSGGLLGMGASSTYESSVNTPAWVGLVLALGGAGALAFGARALFVAFEGRGQV
jgi:hypothetical protein